ncbi:ankyrin repeat-containing domain protein, partial [Truncatella angustata]
MEPLAKKPRLDVTITGHQAELPNDVLWSQRYNRSESSTFHGSGVQVQNGSVDVGRDLIVNNFATTNEPNDHRRSLLETLRFDQIDARHLSIKNAHATTCRWFLQTPIYKTWEEKDPEHNGNNFLWIKGKPGAGKSTLMKFLLGQSQIRIHKKRSNDVVVSFFFNARGDDLEKSTVGLYRSLLLQLLETRPELQHLLDTSRPGRRWDIGSLKSLFEKVVQHLGEIPVICLIDALDECEEVEVRAMVDFLSDMVHIGKRLYICFASRHYPHITVNTGLSIILEERDEHQTDIATYLNSALRIGHSKLAEEIRSDLQEKASGVFMWVVLVVDILNKEYDAGCNHTLRERLRQLPGDLHELFRDILTRDTNHQDALLLCIQWVLFAKQSLTSKQLYFAILSGFEPQYLPDCHSDDISDDDVQRYILNNSKGLVELTKSKMATIQFIHESVRDFLLKEGGLDRVFPHLGTNIPGRSHEALKHCCLRYMGMEAVIRLGESSREATNLKFPFLEYANHSIFYHADQAESYGVSQGDFLAHFPLPEWIRHYNALQKHDTRRYTPKASLLYILAESDTPALVRAYRPRQSYFEVEDERYGLPILAAVAMKSSATVQAMLELRAEQMPEFSFAHFCSLLPSTSSNKHVSSRNFTFSKKRGILPQLVENGNEAVSLFFLVTENCDFDLRDKQGKSVLMHAIERGYRAVSEELVQKGADISAADNDGKTPLHHASSSGQAKVATLLIDRGADISTTDKDGKTPLYHALSLGQVDVALLLIDRGADISTTDKDGKTPLYHALSLGQVDV